MSVSVSETIGKLLLEGYKMLAESCEVCCTVLMQDRRGRVICVQCESAQMAVAAAESMNNASSGTGKIVNGSAGLNNFNHETTTNQRNITSSNGSNNNAAVNRGGSTANTTTSSISNCQDVLTKEIENAATSLQLLSQQKHDIQARSVYVKYIRECAETLQALKGLGKQN